MIKPIILLGTERSGTNLLRRTLDAHSQIASPPPSGLLANMVPYRHKYLNGNIQNGMESWVLAALALLDTHPSNWEIKLSAEEVLARIGGERSHWKLFQILNEIYAEKHHASYWLSKEPGGLNYAYELLLNLPKAKFIYLVRDGRDVASSMIKYGLHAQHIYTAANIWRNDQLRGMQYMSDPCMKNKIFLVRYEEFLASPNEIMASLFNFIGCEYEDHVLDSYQNASVLRYASRSELWKNLSNPIMKDNSAKYKKLLSKSQVHLFETIAIEQMEFFGYPPEFADDVSLSFLKRMVFDVHAKFNKRINMLKPRIKKEIKIREEFSLVSSRIAQGELFVTDESFKADGE